MAFASEYSTHQGLDGLDSWLSKMIKSSKISSLRQKEKDKMKAAAEEEAIRRPEIRKKLLLWGVAGGIALFLILQKGLD